MWSYFLSINMRVTHPLKFVIFWGILLSLLLLQTGYSEPKEEVFVFSNLPEWAPYSTTDESHSSPGIIMEVLSQALDRTNTPFETHTHPNQRQFLMLKHGKIDSFPRPKSGLKHQHNSIGAILLSIRWII